MKKVLPCFLQSMLHSTVHVDGSCAIQLPFYYQQMVTKFMHVHKVPLSSLSKCAYVASSLPATKAGSTSALR